MFANNSHTCKGKGWVKTRADARRKMLAVLFLLFSLFYFCLLSKGRNFRWVENFSDQTDMMPPKSPLLLVGWLRGFPDILFYYYYFFYKIMSTKIQFPFTFPFEYCAYLLVCKDTRNLRVQEVASGVLSPMGIRAAGCKRVGLWQEWALWLGSTEVHLTFYWDFVMVEPAICNRRSRSVSCTGMHFPPDCTISACLVKRLGVRCTWMHCEKFTRPAID